jgi:hypothetical protein
MTSALPELEARPPNAVEPAGKKGAMEGFIETVATALGNSVAWMAQNGILFVIFAAIWVAFGVALVVSQGSIDQAWQWIRSLPLIVQVGAWLLFLPVMVGLWIWETTWPLAVRLVLVIGIAGWNLLVFIPRAALNAQP